MIYTIIQHLTVPFVLQVQDKVSFSKIIDLEGRYRSFRGKDCWKKSDSIM